jgi:hypothetical protein
LKLSILALHLAIDVHVRAIFVVRWSWNRNSRGMAVGSWSWSWSGAQFVGGVVGAAGAVVSALIL